MSIERHLSVVVVAQDCHQMPLVVADANAIAEVLRDAHAAAAGACLWLALGVVVVVVVVVGVVGVVVGGAGGRGDGARGHGRGRGGGGGDGAPECSSVAAANLESFCAPF